MNDPKRLRFLILAALEEAGEDDLSALTNTVLTDRRGSRDELGMMVSVITDLLKEGMVGIAKSRNRKTQRWKPLAEDESFAVLQSAPAHFHWSSQENLWKWKEGSGPRAEIVLTDVGLDVARKMLNESGWPAELAQRY